ncbi:hypothetical protein SAMN05444161_6135 [Rhizobiales bacterium GAS191]|nr:hypothetical protein SAMN05444161_6135 [Rhizobiales bacterium GAS191]
MMFALDTKKLKLWIAAAALGLGAMAFSAPTEARGFGGGGFHGGAWVAASTGAWVAASTGAWVAASTGAWVASMAAWAASMAAG